MENTKPALLLSGRTAVVTGSTKGIGYATAKFLGQSGCRVAILGRNSDNLRRAATCLRELGIDVLPLQCDVRSSDAAALVMREVQRVFGSLDILVNNVGGIPSTSSFLDLTDADWSACFDLNLLSAVRFIRAALPHLKHSQTGRIINIASFVAIQPGTFNPHYSVCKAGLINLTKHLSNVLAPDGILVNAISPGNIDTPSWQDHIAEAARQEGLPVEAVKTRENKRVTEPASLKRMGTPEEVASCALFLASDAASFITGTNLIVDGGRIKSV